jgi:hypothetical protein
MGPESAELVHYARVFSEALGRPIRYRDVPLPAWSEGLRRMGFPEHVVSHLSAMTELNRQGRYDRMTNTMHKLTGEAPTNMRDFVKLHAAEFNSVDRRIPEALNTSRERNLSSRASTFPMPAASLCTPSAAAWRSPIQGTDHL